ncbi:MAG: FtsX-like permease family protein [Pseudomonadota bacterium]
MIRLAALQMADRPIPVALNILLIAFAAALLIILARLSNHFETRFDRDLAGVDLVVSAKGSPLQVILSSLFHVDFPTGNIPYEAAESLSKDPLVALAIPLAVGDQFRGFRVVGTTTDYLSLYQADAGAGIIDIAEENAVIGAAAARALGITIGQKFAVTHGLAEAGGGAEHDAHPLTVTAILKPTGSVIDRLILTSIEAVWEAHGIEHDDHGHEADDHATDHHDEAETDHDDGDHHHDDEDHEHEGHDAHKEPKGSLEQDPEVTAVLIKYASPLAAVRLPEKINSQSQLMAAVPAYEAARLLGLFGFGESVARVLTLTLALLGGFAIFASLWSALEAREADIALYRLLGAQPRHIFALLLFEGTLTAACGAFSAWGIAWVTLWQLSRRVDYLAQSGFATVETSGLENAILIAVICLGAIAALPASVQAARTPLDRALA